MKSCADGSTRPLPRYRRYYLAINIKADDTEFNDNLTSIEACFGPANGSWPDDRLITFSRSLLDDKQAVSTYELLHDFSMYCELLYSVFEETEKAQIALVCFRPDFVIGRLDYIGHKTGAFAHPLRYLTVSSNQHRCFDPKQHFEALHCREEGQQWLKEKVSSKEKAKRRYYEMVFIYTQGRRFRKAKRDFH